jgi:serine/threonine-protein kinase
MKRFRAEATILARLNHPHIATIYDLVRSDTDLLMVMEYVRGETLDKLSQRLGPMPPEGAAYLVDSILSALEHAHRAGIVHRDMKPANVMVTEGGGVKIMDFGIARVRGAEQMTVDGRLMGTPAYMPPEQVLGQEVDGRADLYSVGVVFYRLLTGALPFKADTALAMMQRQIIEPPMPLSVHRAALPEWCDTIVQRALAKDPEDRFQTAEELRETLRDAAGVLQTAEFAATFVIETPTTDTLDLSRVDPESSVPMARSAFSERWRKPLLWANAIAAVGAIASALGYAAAQRNAADAVIAVPAPPPAVSAMNAPAAPMPAPVVLEPRPAAVPAARKPEPARVAMASPPPVSTPAPAPAASAPKALEAEEDVAASRPAPRAVVAEAPLVFEAKTLVGTRKPREHDAQLVLADGRITVTSELEAEYPFYSIPYDSVLSITYSRGRDPMWASPEGPMPVTRGGGTLGRLGIVVSRDWISLRTNTKDQFVAMRFNDVLVRRVLLALEERTGRKPQLIAEPKDPD